ncbi:MAG: CBS domain-containing protein [Deltaproteobacteria bacterium]|nr:CBS domain-containing protein [Deltaproteobacteria bacterium]
MPLRFTPIRRYMSSPVRSLQVDATLADAHAILREHAFSSLPVLDPKGTPAGVLSRTDLLRVGRVTEHRPGRASLLEVPDRQVGEVMSSPVVSLGPDDTVRAAAEKMVRHRIHRVYVVEHGRLVGVFSTRDVMAAVRDQRIATPINEFMSTPVLTVDVADTVGCATDRLSEARVAGLVVTEDERPVGLFTQTEALQSREDPASTPVEDRMSYALLCMDLKTPVHRAAAHAHATQARRVVAVEGRRMWGLLTGVDFARAATG